jgi:hypothetical protein
MKQTYKVEIDQDIEEWRLKIKNTDLCGIVQCFNKPTKQCKKCTNYYCQEHFPSHLDLLPDGETEYSSSNEGLECFMDDESEDFGSSEAPIWSDVNNIG